MKEPKPSPTPFRLSSLDDVILDPAGRELLEDIHGQCSGPAVYRYRKLAEIRDLLAMAQAAPRLRIQAVDARQTLRLRVLLRVPVPLHPAADGTLRTAPEAQLAIVYPERALSLPMPGSAFISLLKPAGVWHANVSTDGTQALCLGATLPASIQLKHLLLMAYEALSLQSVMVSETDPAGVLNRTAALWWQRHLHLSPLTRENFFDAVGRADERTSHS